mmetsp:Transcript_4412/g.13064  ORF Transcript_4412/g.13064 Transcript_4412/m.13064 type:complete len:118 (+) Transcript_4412:935-1288(+)
MRLTTSMTCPLRASITEAATRPSVLTVVCRATSSSALRLTAAIILLRVRCSFWAPFNKLFMSVVRSRRSCKRLWRSMNEYLRDDPSIIRSHIYIIAHIRSQPTRAIAHLSDLGHEMK